MLSALVSKQAAPTEKNNSEMHATFRLRSITRRCNRHLPTSNMRLVILSNALYLSEPKAQSRAGSQMFMAGTEDIPINNGAILNILQIIRAVMSSAAEAEVGALFINAKTAVSMQRTFNEMGHPQTCTPIQAKKFSAYALLTNKILPKVLKAMDMQIHWLHCCKAQDQYRFYWRPGTQNLAD